MMYSVSFLASCAHQFARNGACSARLSRGPSRIRSKPSQIVHLKATPGVGKGLDIQQPLSEPASRSIRSAAKEILDQADVAGLAGTALLNLAELADSRLESAQSRVESAHTLELQLAELRAQDQKLYAFELERMLWSHKAALDVYGVLVVRQLLEYYERSVGLVFPTAKFLKTLPEKYSKKGGRREYAWHRHLDDLPNRSAVKECLRGLGYDVCAQFASDLFMNGNNLVHGMSFLEVEDDALVLRVATEIDSQQLQFLQCIAAEHCSSLRVVRRSLGRDLPDDESSHDSGAGADVSLGD